MRYIASSSIALLTLLIALQLLSPALSAPSEQADESEMPITSTAFPDDVHPSQFFSSLVEGDGESKFKPAAEMEKYISDSLEESDLEDKSWLDALNVYLASLALVMVKEEAGQESDRWLELALQAAGVCHDHEPNERLLSTISGYYGEKAW
ncbi:MAG: hypothetical protein JW941_03235, partial [Candidatus Coatesbacteria bacterium]|nr:hypothetical protein [Candidatus Coatesbacteria bacterium]